MSQERSQIGRVFWTDLTVADAPRVRDFYSAVIGWQPSGVDMGGYEDFNMTPPGETGAAAGICHARGGNASMPPQWMIYVPVKNLTASLEACQKMGGKILRQWEGFCCIQDPAGAVMVICQAKG